MTSVRLLVLAGVVVSAAASGAFGSETVPEPVGRAGASTAGERTTRLQGAAILGRRSGVVGASVVARSETDPSRVYLTTTDGRGRFRMDGLPEGSYRVDLRRDGLAPVTKHGVELRYPYRAVVEVPMTPGTGTGEPTGREATSTEGPARVVGQVLARGGGPAGEVSLRFLRADGSEDPRLVRANKDGRFVLGNLTAGSWQVTMRGLGLLPIEADLDLVAETRLTLVAIPQPGDYTPSPLELLPLERPAVPASLEPGPLGLPVLPELPAEAATAAGSGDAPADAAPGDEAVGSDDGAAEAGDRGDEEDDEAEGADAAAAGPAESEGTSSSELLGGRTAK